MSLIVERKLHAAFEQQENDVHLPAHNGDVERAPFTRELSVRISAMPALLKAA